MATQTIDLGYRPREWQKVVHKTRKRFTVCALHRRAGKTELAVMELINSALKFRKDLGLFAYIAPYLRQAKAIAWQRLKHYACKIPGVEVNETELWIRLPGNGVVIRIFGGDNADSLRGLRLDGVVIDEVAQIKPELWEEVVQPALSDRKGWALFIGTPKGLNLFSRLYFDAQSKPDWHHARYTVYDTQAIDAAEVVRLRADMSENAFAREYLCDFTASGDNQLISIAEVEDASRRAYAERDYLYAPLVIGVDVARFGDDSSVIQVRQGLAAHIPTVYHGVDNMTLAGHVAGVIDKYKPDAVFIDAGHGQGVIDRLRSLGHPVIEVHFGGKPNADRFLNKRAEMWESVAEWVRAGGSIPDVPRLKQDLATPTYSYNAAGKIQLESKDAIRERGLPSPDLGDALALTFAFQVQKKQHNPFNQRPGRMVATDYDPYR